jgi:translation initiation factor IF-2
MASQSGVSVFSSSVIYQVMDEVKERVIALLPVIKESKVTGEATVLQLFDIHMKAKQIRKVAGCRVINGLLEKSKEARVIRHGTTIHQGDGHVHLQCNKNLMVWRLRNVRHDASTEERCD